VHEGAEVAQRGVVQVEGGDPLRDRGGEPRGDVVHVGQPVGQRDGDLPFGGAFGDAGADRCGQRELAAEVVGAGGADAEVGADRRDPVGLAQPGAGGPAIGELGLLVGEREVLALVLLGLDAADLIRRRRVVEQQHEQRAHGPQPVLGQRVAAPGGQQPALPGVQHHALSVLGGAVADARNELAGGHKHVGEAVDALGGDVAARVGGELEVLERDPDERAGCGGRGGGGDIEQRGRGCGRRGRVWHCGPFG